MNDNEYYSDLKKVSHKVNTQDDDSGTITLKELLQNEAQKNVERYNSTIGRIVSYINGFTRSVTGAH